MKNNKVFLSVIAAMGLSLSLGANAAVVSVTTGSNPYYQYQQENLASQQQPQTLPQSATNIQAQQRMQTMQQQNTQANTPFDPTAQAYQDAANINQQGNTQQTQTQAQTQQKDTGPKNAFEQGYGSEQESLAQQEALEEWVSLQSARQKGETVNVPVFKSSNAVGSDKRSSVWLTNWKGILVEQVGMKPEKVDFEASRLTKEEFAAWASRQVRYVEPNTIAVNP